jgi:calcineurin-like phosphoesterase family protein
LDVRNIFFTSDTHFFHENILFFKKEGGARLREEFETLNEMHETIINNWNGVVRPQDHVWHLGDVTFRYHGEFNNLMSRLNGHKRLCVGNHDKLKNPNLLRWFDKINLWRGWHDEGFTCTHIPLPLGSIRDGKVNVHGHMHSQSMDDPHYINICVEKTNYTPISMEEIKVEIKARNL